MVLGGLVGVWGGVVCLLCLLFLVFLWWWLVSFIGFRISDIVYRIVSVIILQFKGGGGGGWGGVGGGRMPPQGIKVRDSSQCCYLAWLMQLADGSIPRHDVCHELTFSTVRLRTSAEQVQVILWLMMGACLGHHAK